MQKAGIPCPTVVLLKKHILVMSFIGHDQVPAPKLKEVKLSTEEMKEAYYQTLRVSCACCEQCAIVPTAWEAAAPKPSCSQESVFFMMITF